MIRGCTNTPVRLDREFPFFQWRPGKPQCLAAHPLPLHPEPPAPGTAGQVAGLVVSSHTLFPAPTLARCPVTCGSICPPIFVSRQQHTLLLWDKCLCPAEQEQTRGFPHPRTENTHTWTQPHMHERNRTHTSTTTHTWTQTTHTWTQPHTHTHARTRAHTHTNKNGTYGCAFGSVTMTVCALSSLVLASC